MVDDTKERYEKHIQWLEASIESLTEENEALHAELLKTQRTLEDMIPLRRHFKRQVKHHLGRVDKNITNTLSRTNRFRPVDAVRISKSKEDLLQAAHDYDQQNFADYTMAAKPHKLLPAYTATKNTAYKTFRKTKAVLHKNQ